MDTKPNVAKVTEDAKVKVIVEGSKVVHYEESIYSLAIALTQTEQKLALIINRQAKLKKINLEVESRDKIISSFEVAEVFGTSFFILLSQALAVAILMYST